MRYTTVFVLEDGVWRCIQDHVSLPVANEEALGVTLTTTLTKLLDSLDADTLYRSTPVRGTASLMFTDIKGSTVLAMEMGDRKWSRHRGSRPLHRRHGAEARGRVLKTSETVR